MTDQIANQTDCGGCHGLGAHSPRCSTQPGWIWRCLADEADRIANRHSGDPDAQNTAWAAQGQCKHLAHQAAAGAS